MGSSLNAMTQPQTFRRQDYYRIKDISGVHADNQRTLRSKLTGEEIEQYDITLENSELFEEYVDLYRWRYSQTNVVKALDLLQQSTRSLCSVSYHVQVRTERIMFRLGDVAKLCYPDNLYVLISALNGFSNIVEKKGWFDVKQRMIGVNAEGEVKVWLNPDLSLSRPDFGFHQKYKESMIHQIIYIVDEHTKTETSPQSISQFLVENIKQNSFKEAIGLVREFVELVNIRIPSRLSAKSQPSPFVGFLQEQDFNLSESNGGSCVSFKKANKSNKQSFSAFDKLYESLSSNHISQGNGSKLNPNLIPNRIPHPAQRGTWSNSPQCSQFHPPSIVTESIPVARLPQQPIGKLLPNFIITQQKQLSSSSSVSYQTENFAKISNHHNDQGRISNAFSVAQLKQTLNPNSNNNSVSLEYSYANARIPSDSRYSAFQNPNQNQPCFNQYQIANSICSVNSKGLQSGLYQRNNYQQPQQIVNNSQTFNFKEPSQKSFISNRKRNQQNIQPIEKNSQQNIHINYHSPFETHQIDSMIAKDLRKMKYH